MQSSHPVTTSYETLRIEKKRKKRRRNERLADSSQVLAIHWAKNKFDEKRVHKKKKATGISSAGGRLFFFFGLNARIHKANTNAMRKLSTVRCLSKVLGLPRIQGLFQHSPGKTRQQRKRAKNSVQWITVAMGISAECVHESKLISLVFNLLR